jgi:hypothetical protein
MAEAPSLKPGASGWIVITNGRHHNSSETLPGCPEHHAVFNDPTVIAAEYLAASVRAAEEIYKARLGPMALDEVRTKNLPERVKVNLPAEGSYVDGLHYVPVPLRPTTISQQWGQQWADGGHQGVGTRLPVAPPPGRKNLWTCVYLRPNTVLAVISSTPWPDA